MSNKIDPTLIGEAKIDGWIDGLGPLSEVQRRQIGEYLRAKVSGLIEEHLTRLCDQGVEQKLINDTSAYCRSEADDFIRSRLGC